MTKWVINKNVTSGARWGVSVNYGYENVKWIQFSGSEARVRRTAAGDVWHKTELVQRFRKHLQRAGKDPTTAEFKEPCTANSKSLQCKMEFSSNLLVAANNYKKKWLQCKVKWRQWKVECSATARRNGCNARWHLPANRLSTNWLPLKACEKKLK